MKKFSIQVGGGNKIRPTLHEIATVEADSFDSIRSNWYAFYTNTLNWRGKVVERVKVAEFGGASEAMILVKEIAR